MGWIGFTGYMGKGASNPPLSPYPRRSLTVVPLIADKRYYGEAPVRLRRGYGAAPGQMRCESAVEIECWESGAPKGAGRFQIGHDQEPIGVRGGTSRHEPSEQ